MGIECAVISGIFAIFIVVFLCTKRPAWALATPPLMLVPLTDFGIEYLVIKAFKVEVTAFGGIMALLVAVAAAAVWAGLYAGHLDHKRYKASYIGLTNVFNVVLAAIIISDILSKTALDSAIQVIDKK